MRYIPDLTAEEIKNNHTILEQRRAVYKEKGLDFLKSREFILEKAGPLNGSILDIGSGKGITALSLAKAGYRFITIDNDEQMLRITALNLAWENLLSRAELHVMDAHSVEFKENTFNDIFMIEALHHFGKAESIFWEIDRVLSPGGRLILSDFNKNGMRLVDNVHLSEGHKHESSSVGKAEALAWLCRAGYTVAEYDDVCHWLLIAVKGGK